jgi:hypothetical protein
MAVLTPTSTYTAQTAPSVTTYLDYNETGGKLRTFLVEDIISGTDATSDTKKILRLPKGFTMIPSLSYVTLEDPGTTLTLDLGDNDTAGTDADRYCNDLVLSSGGNVGLASALGTFGVAATRPFKTTSECDLTATYVSVSTPTASAKILYVIVGTLE